MIKVQKGKQGTKGSKQIIQENVATITFYRNMILGVTVFYAFMRMYIYDGFPINHIVLSVFGLSVTSGCLYFLVSMANLKKDESGVIIDEGCDLNIEGGLAEHVKDAIILTSTCGALSAFSVYFWLLWLLAPLRAFQMLWQNFLGPWFFQQAPEELEICDKKQKKIERKRMKVYR